MFCIASETEGEVAVKHVTPPPSNSLLTVPRRKFCCGSLLPVVGVRVSMTFHLTCVHIIFSSVLVTVWPSFGKSCSHRLTICSLCILTICIFSFGFEGWILVLIVSVPVFLHSFNFFSLSQY